MCFTSTLIYPSISDVITAIEEAEEIEKTSPKTEESKTKTTSRSTSDIDSEIDLFLMLFELWSLNFYTQFTRAPYYGGNSLLFIPPGMKIFSNQYNHWWYSTGTGTTYLHNIGLGTFATFDGCIYSFFGPQLEVYSFADKNKDLLYGTKLGGNVALIQTNPFSLYLYVQYALLNSNLLSIPYSGTCIGLEIRSFIVKPVTFKLRTDFSDFETFQLYDFTVQLGIMLKKNELYLGYRSWEFKQADLSLSKSRGATIGYRYYL